MIHDGARMITPENILKTADDAAKYLKEEWGDIPAIAVVTGSGWEGIISGAKSTNRVEFESVPGFEVTRVPGHRGTLRLVETGAGPVLVQEGRNHIYEGHSPLQVCFPVWVYRKLGVRSIVLLGSSGGLNSGYKPGDLVIISDHIYLFGDNPLTGIDKTDERSPFIRGDRIYSSEMQKLLYDCVTDCPVHERGLYVYVAGPSYETPSESRFFKTLGGDVVGMSVAPEAITASYLGMKVGAMCCVSNRVSEGSGEDLTHELVLEVTGQVAGRLGNLLESLARHKPVGSVGIEI